MSTNSNIGILYKDGTVEAIYCHWDGYFDHNGVLLYDYVKTLEQVKEMLSKGDLSYIEEKDHQLISEHYIDRGGNPEGNKSQFFKSKREYLRFLHKNTYIEYSYLFSEKDNNWLCYKNRTNKDFEPLQDILYKEKLIEHEGKNFTIYVINKNDKPKFDKLLYEHNEITRFLYYNAKSFYDDEQKYIGFFWEKRFSPNCLGLIKKILEKEDIPYTMVAHSPEQTHKTWNSLDVSDSFYDEILKEARIICPSYGNNSQIEPETSVPSGTL